jgi:hypothetical protein
MQYIRIASKDEIHGAYHHENLVIVDVQIPDRRGQFFQIGDLTIFFLTNVCILFILGRAARGNPNVAHI